MPRVSTKKSKTKAASQAVVESPEAKADSAAPAAAEPAPAPEPALQPPSKPIEPTSDGDAKISDREPREGREGREPREPREDRRGYQRDKIAASLNIAKLQAMQMSELNAMAREYGVENFGTMRKHEVIFHILQKNAERAGVLFSEGVLEILPEGFGFRRRKSAASICRRETWSPDKSGRRRKKKSFSRC
jgi:transcription termination factor Rho